MEVKEMHIEVNQTLQKQGASVTRKFYAEEIDWALNKAQLRFRDSRIRRKADNSGAYEIDQIHMDAVRVWLKTDVQLSTFVRNTQVSYGILPNDYEYLISDRSLVVSNCGPSPTTETVAYQKIVIPFPKSAANSAPYYNNLTVNEDGSPVYTFSGGITVQDDRFIFTNLISRNTTWYWERLGEYYEPGKWIILVEGTGHTATLVYDGTTRTGVSTAVNFTRYTSEGVVTASNRLTNHSELPEVLTTPFYKPRATSPVSALDSGILKTYTDGNFTVNGLLIDYIRKPRRISLSLDQHCELPEGFHQEVCDLAVQIIMGDIGDPRLQTKTQQDLLQG